jgi:hypothetical protein
MGTTKKGGPMRRLSWGLGIVALMLFSLPNPRAEGQTTAQEATWIEKGKDAVRAKMKDPESTQFRNVFFHRGIDNMPLTCGEVSGKTHLGGDGGFQRFVSGGNPLLTYLEEEVTNFPAVWEQMCQ